MMPVYAIDARAISPHFPGIGRYLRSLIQAMSGSLIADETLVVIQNDELPIPKPSPRSGRLISCLASASSFSLSQQWQIPKLLKGSGAQVFHSPYYLMPYRPGIPTVLTVYDLIPFKYPQTVSARARLLFRTASRLALSRASQIIAISENTRQDYLRAFQLPPTKITTIPLAADPSFCPQPTGEIDRVRDKYSLGSYLLYLGINKPHKNLLRLVEAWKMFVDSGGTAGRRLVIAGPWDRRYPESMQLAERLGIRETLLFTGPIPPADLPGLYAGAGLFVYPSLYEGFGLPVLEAMASCAPVICAQSPGLVEVAGDAARMFDPLQPEDIAGAIVQLLKDEELRRDLVEKGLTRAASFSWQRTAEETINIYRRMAKTG
jgi:alpha-1,3-rhamnosyl/mannosyltransferase